MISAGTVTLAQKVFFAQILLVVTFILVMLLGLYMIEVT
jgi:hypothetical protein